MPPNKLDAEFVQLHAETTRLLSALIPPKPQSTLHHLNLIDFAKRADASGVSQLAESARQDAVELMTAIMRFDRIEAANKKPRPQ